MQAPLFDGFAFDPFSLFDDGGCSAEVGVCRRKCSRHSLLMIAVLTAWNKIDRRQNLVLGFA
jgi:hypothetical protein